MKYALLVVALLVALACAQNVTIVADGDLIQATCTFGATEPTITCTDPDTDVSYSFVYAAVSAPDTTGCSTSLTSWTRSGDVYTHELGSCLNTARIVVSLVLTGSTSTLVNGLEVPAHSVQVNVRIENVPSTFAGGRVVIDVRTELPSDELASGSIQQGFLSDGRIALGISDEGVTASIYQETTTDVSARSAWSSRAAGSASLANAQQVSDGKVTGVLVSTTLNSVQPNTTSVDINSSVFLQKGPDDPTSDDDDDDDDVRTFAVVGAVVGAFGAVLLLLAALACLLALIVVLILVAIIICVAVIGGVYVAIGMGGAYFGVGPFSNLFGRGQEHPGQKSMVYIESEESDDESESSDDVSEESEEDSDL